MIRYPKINFSQLFDLQSDPHEMTNLAEQPEQAGKLKQMMALLQQAQRQYGDTAPLSSEHPLDAKWSPPVKSAVAKPEQLQAQNLIR